MTGRLLATEWTVRVRPAARLPLRVLFICPGGGLGGAERVLLELLEGQILAAAPGLWS